MSLFNQGEKAYLLLADGTILEGIHFGVKERQSEKSYLRRV